MEERRVRLEDSGQNEPLEFKILELRGSGLNRFDWFHNETKLGAYHELEAILNKMGADGWDISQFVYPVLSGQHRVVILKRKAR